MATLLPTAVLQEVSGTFLASIRSIGTAVTLASVGVYLHRRGFVDSNGKRTLALISQQITVPLFLFTKIIYCNQDWSTNPCPDITRTLANVWMILLWPAVTVSLGLLVGAFVARVCRTPKNQVTSVLAACGFGNSTGLPITLLTVVHTNFPATSDLGRIDPTIFLSVYLLVYPILQWGIGGCLLAAAATPPSNGSERDGSIVRSSGTASVADNPDEHHPASPRRDLRTSMLTNVLNNKEAQAKLDERRSGLTSSDEGLYISEMNLKRLGGTASRGSLSALRGEIPAAPSAPNPRYNGDQPGESSPLIGHSSSFGPAQLDEEAAEDNGYGTYVYDTESCSEDDSNEQHKQDQALAAEEEETPASNEPRDPVKTLLRRFSSFHAQITSSPFEVDSMWEATKNVLNRCFQPPVIGGLTGIVVAVTPLRGIFVDLVYRESRAPLQWLFDGLYNVGSVAVPINMIILGCNLSSGEQAMAKAKKGLRSSTLLPKKTMIGVVIGKMIVLPFVGIGLTWFLKEFVLNIPEEIAGAFYLVLMIVFLTPTANNVMVMVELSGSNAKEGMAACIALQYAVAPIFLSLTMTIAIGIASGWSM